MSATERLPLLPLDDTVVLPGMAVPVELDDAEARVAVDAARAQEGTARVLLVPRLDGRYAGVGTVAVVQQVGRLPGGG
ncbi:MAG TPA: LON peptidase substrate-binding domain-containing protein, partial [Geodermatophilus sp.]|nr:LON peptidase substrate-binding domain-containing protein [Geodermatophilus sp.]